MPVPEPRPAGVKINDCESLSTLSFLVGMGLAISYLSKGEAGLTKLAAWAIFLFFPGIAAVVFYRLPAGNTRSDLISKLGVPSLILVSILIRFYRTNNDEPFVINSFFSWIVLWLLMFIGLASKGIGALARFGDIHGIGKNINTSCFWADFLFALGIFSWLTITPEGAFFSRTGFLFALTILSLTAIGLFATLIRLKRRFDCHVALSGSVLLAVSLTVFPLLFLSSPETKGAASFNEAFNAIKLIELSNQVQTAKPKDNAIIANVSAAAYKIEQKKLYLVTSDAVLGLCSQGLLNASSETPKNKSSPIAIRFNQKTSLPIIKMAIEVRDGRLILLEVDAEKLKFGEDFSLLRFPTEVTAERATEFQVARFEGDSLSTAVVEIKETSRFSKLSRARELHFKCNSPSHSSADFIFCLLPGKGIYWLGLKSGSASESAFFKATVAPSLLTGRFKWFNLETTDLRDVITFHQNCLDD